MQLDEAGIWLFEGVPQNFTVIKVSAFGMFAKGYLKKPVAAAEIKRVLDEMVTDWSLEKTEKPCDIRVQTFGYFEVFADGKPVIFEREKSKELLSTLAGVPVLKRNISTPCCNNESVRCVAACKPLGPV